MKIEEDKIVMPGDKLGIIEQYLPGDGTYDAKGSASAVKSEIEAMLTWGSF